MKQGIFRALGVNRKINIYYVSPKVNWSLDWDAFYITQEIERSFAINASVTATAAKLKGQLVHFGSLWSLANEIDKKHTKQNIIVGTIFHGEKNDINFKTAFEKVLENKEKITRLHVANRIMEKRLETWGFPREKIVRIPLGVDLSVFAPSDQQNKELIRKELDIPENAFCIGSFQKDGVGWGDGVEPKLIKGPDIFLKVVELVNRQYPVFVLLSAPARGYIKKGLTDLRIPFKHVLQNDYLTMPRMYHALDAYLVTSREEGGPKGVLESLATGIPVVSTRVGLSPDVITHGLDGFLADSEDVKKLAEHVTHLLENPNVTQKLRVNGLRLVNSFDWSIIAAQYYFQIYGPIINDLFYPEWKEREDEL